MSETKMSHKIVAIHQPNYLPYLGFFDKMKKCDIFVILDDVNFTDGEFLQRNRIRISLDMPKSKGWIWLTVPIKKKQIPCNQIRIKNDVLSFENSWSENHWNQIIENYKKTPFFYKYSKKLEDIYSQKYEKIIDLNMAVINYLMACFGITTKVVFASTLGITSTGSQRLLDIVKAVGGDTYLSGISGLNYLNASLFEKAGIKVIYQIFEHPVYKQRYEGFIPNMSAIDYLFNIGGNEIVKPLLIILSPRDIGFVKKGLDKINYVDKYWIKYCILEEAILKAFEYFFEHKEYTHIIIHSDDAVPDYESVALLIADIKKYNFPVISGIISIDKVQNKENIAATITKMNTHYEKYETLPLSILDLKSIIKVWFQGWSMTFVRRDVAEKLCPLLAYRDEKGKPHYAQIRPIAPLDFRTAQALEKLGIPQYVDLRVWYWHYQYPIKELYDNGEWKIKIGKIPPYTIFEPAVIPVPTQVAAEIIDPLPDEWIQKIKDYNKPKEVVPKHIDKQQQPQQTHPHPSLHEGRQGPHP